MNARLGDFGLARLYNHGADPPTTDVAGKFGNILEARDQKLGTDFVVEEVELVLKLGLLCSRSQPTARPSMRQVMQYLEGEMALPEFSFLRLSSTSLEFANDEGFDNVAMSYQSSHAPESDVLSGGR
ncbi:hypothetical protein M0R45_028862 [Rubus argutus]|uniref:Uncharacterized protein n=1 Tax=Rubus argutus TaxID=59490 RepID=A0AAW1W6D3_RUBAR